MPQTQTYAKITTMTMEKKKEEQYKARPVDGDCGNCTKLIFCSIKGMELRAFENYGTYLTPHGL